MVTFTPKLSERKRILLNICKNNPQWKKRMLAIVLLLIVSVGIIVFTVYLLLSHRTTAFGVFIFLCVGICLSCVPLFISISLKNSSKYKCAFPYSSYANAMLVLSDDTLQYVFWRVGPHEPAAYSSKRAVYNDKDKFIYSIRKTDIKKITIENEICQITGLGTIQIPEWAGEDSFVKNKNKHFSFIMAFEEKNADMIINEWRN